jgi:hypothetical protein
MADQKRADGMSWSLWDVAAPAAALGRNAPSIGAGSNRRRRRLGRAGRRGRRVDDSESATSPTCRFKIKTVVGLDVSGFVEGALPHFLEPSGWDARLR